MHESFDRITIPMNQETRAKDLLQVAPVQDGAPAATSFQDSHLVTQIIEAGKVVGSEDSAAAQSTGSKDSQ